MLARRQAANLPAISIVDITGNKVQIGVLASMISVEDRGKEFIISFIPHLLNQAGCVDLELMAATPCQDCLLVLPDALKCSQATLPDRLTLALTLFEL